MSSQQLQLMLIQIIIAGTTRKKQKRIMTRKYLRTVQQRGQDSSSSSLSSSPTLINFISLSIQIALSFLSLLLLSPSMTHLVTYQHSSTALVQLYQVVLTISWHRVTATYCHQMEAATHTPAQGKQIKMIMWRRFQIILIQSSQSQTTFFSSSLQAKTAQQVGLRRTIPELSFTLSFGSHEILRQNIMAPKNLRFQFLFGVKTVFVQILWNKLPLE